MEKYELEYEWATLATVIIDPAKAATPIKEMVEFWSSSERRLEKAKGDYTKAWLTMLALHILNHGKPPANDDEGWYPLDGTHGITLKNWTAWEPDEDAITITP